MAPRLDNYIGKHVFEAVCRQFVAASRHERLPFRPYRIGSWWTRDGQDEIDVVALGVGGEVLLAECKWIESGEILLFTPADLFPS